MFRPLSCLALAFPLAATAVHAGEVPRYEAAPAWVLPAPAPGPAGDAAPLLQTLNQQSRIENGAVWEYHEIAGRAISAEALSHIGTITLSWQPFHGDLVVHRVSILRDGQRIDALASGDRFTVIRREQKLEQLEIDGALTATLQVQGLRVGDVLDYAFSITSKDPVLKGQVQASELAMAQPVKIGFARARFTWPTGAPVRWRAYPAGIVATESDAAGWHALDLALPAPKQPDLPKDAPPRFHPLPLAEVSSFAGWADVSRTTAPLYATDGLIAPGSPLANEVARIRAASPDPLARAAAALALVQDRVRYFANGMNGGNYTPQPPAQTWTAGYGDCKAKTLLLLALLHALGIDAEPVLASIGAGDYVQGRLASLAAFNHIFVHAKVAGADLWLDGTGNGSRIDDLRDPPPLRWVLPVRAAGADLLLLPSAAPARPTRTIALAIDESAGIRLPAPFTAMVILRGGIADQLRAAVAQLDKEHLAAIASAALGGAAGNATVITARPSFDPAAATATIDITGLVLASWVRQDHVYRARPWSMLGTDLDADRARAAWAAIPLAGGAPGHVVTTIRIVLPDGGRGIALEGDPAASVDIAGRNVVRHAALADGVVTITEEERASGAEIPAADLPAARAALVAARGHMVRLAAAPAYPPLYRTVPEAKRAHRLDGDDAAFARLIAEKPDDANRYLARATFDEQTFRYAEAVPDFDRAVAIDASAANLLRRATLLENLGDKARAAADYRAVLSLDPSSKRALARLGSIEVDQGQKAAALAPIDAALAAAGEDKPEWLEVKAEVLARAGDAPGAIAALDEAIGAKPGNAGLYNDRCWKKATLNVQLDTALADCTRSIELSSSNANALDSRAMVYFRLHRPAEARADLDAALDIRPGGAGSLFLRGVIERAGGDTAHGDADIADARMIAPQIAVEYARWGIKP